MRVVVRQGFYCTVYCAEDKIRVKQKSRTDAIIIKADRVTIPRLRDSVSYE